MWSYLQSPFVKPFFQSVQVSLHLDKHSVHIDVQDEAKQVIGEEETVDVVVRVLVDSMMSFMYMVNWIGERMEPCMTLVIISFESEIDAPTFTRNCLFFRKLRIQLPSLRGSFSLCSL